MLLTTKKSYREKKLLTANLYRFQNTDNSAYLILKPNNDFIKR